MADNDKSGWLTRAQVAERFGVTTSAVYYWERSGKLRGENTPQGVIYDPESIEELVAERDTKGQVEQVFATEAAKLLEGSFKHIERLAKLSHEPIHQLITIQQDEIHRQRERIHQLENRHLESIVALEAAFSEQHERESERLRSERSEQRKDEALKMVSEALPVVLQQLSVNQQAKAVLSIVGRFTEEQVEALKASGFITETEFEALKGLARKEEKNGRSETIPKRQTASANSAKSNGNPNDHNSS